MVGRYVPTVVLCELCASVDALRQAEKPGPGHHIVLVTVEEARRRADLLASMGDDTD